MPVELYVRGRSAVLQSFLTMPAIFHHDIFRAEFEASSRSNIAREISDLALASA